MGGCATKPKELKAESAKAPPQAKEEEEAGTVPEAKEITVVDKDKGIADVDTVDDLGNKHRSLSHLFKENEERKDSSETDKMSWEAVVKQEPSETEKTTDVSETKTTLKVEKGESLAEESLTPVVVVDSPIKEAIAEKKIEVVPAPESQNPETAQEKKTEEKKSATEIPKPETPQEKKAEEDNPATEIQKPATPPEKKAKEVAEIQEPKIEEEKPSIDTKTPEEKKVDEDKAAATEKTATETQKTPEETKTEKRSEVTAENVKV